MCRVTVVLGLIASAVTCGCRAPARGRQYAVGNAPVICYGSLAYGDMPVWGSFAAGGSLLDKARSCLVPQTVLCQPGELRGKWFDGERQTALRIEGIDPNAPEHQPHFYQGYPGDCFVVAGSDRGPNAIQLREEFAYGAFSMFPADVDADGLDELVIEAGEGRGTFAYTRSLQIWKFYSEYSPLCLLSVKLSGYISGEPQDGRPLPDPDSWIRRWYFRQAQDGSYEVVLHLMPPARTPRYIHDTEELRVLQFLTEIYGWNSELVTYELRGFVYAPLRAEVPDTHRSGNETRAQTNYPPEE